MRLLFCATVALTSLLGCSGGSGSSNTSGSGLLQQATAGQVNLVGNTSVSWTSGHWIGDQSPSLAYAKDWFQLDPTNGTLVVTVARQVGSDSDTIVPYPTTCTYTISASHISIIAPTGQPYSIYYQADTIVLVTDSANTAACGAFVSRTQALASAGQFVDAFQVTQVSAIQLTSDHGEIYNRQ